MPESGGQPIRFAKGTLDDLAGNKLKLPVLGKEKDAVLPASEELDDAAVSQDLKLLANLRPDVLVIFVHFSQPFFEPVHVDEGELRPSDLSDACKHIRNPATRLRSRIPKEGEGVPGLADILRRYVDAISHCVHPGISRKRREEDVATDPACPPGRRSERGSFLD